MFLAQNALAKLKGLCSPLSAVREVDITSDAAGCGVWVCVRVL
jgi:hypothetical protein